MKFSSCDGWLDPFCCEAAEIRLAGYFMPVGICYNRADNVRYGAWP